MFIASAEQDYFDYSLVGSASWAVDIDKDGTINYKFIGPVNQEILDNEIVPLLRKLLG